MENMKEKSGKIREEKKKAKINVERKRRCKKEIVKDKSRAKSN